MSEVVGGSSAEPPDPGEATAGKPPPRAVRIAVVLMYVVAGLALAQGLLSVVASALDRYHLASGLLALAYAVAYAVLAGRARHGDRTARTVAVVLSALSVVGAIVQLPGNPVAGTVGVLLNGGIIVLLAVHPGSRRFFGSHPDRGRA